MFEIFDVIENYNVNWNYKLHNRVIELQITIVICNYIT